MKHKIYRRYRTKKRGGQHYWVGRTRNYASSKISRLLNKRDDIPSKKQINKDTKLIIDSHNILLLKERGITPVIFNPESGVISMEEHRASVNKLAQLRKQAKTNIRRNYGMASFKINIGKYDQGEYASKVNFDPTKTVVHGTSEDNARKIIQDGKLREGTYLYPGRGGFEDAAIWASNTTKHPVVIMVEADVDKPLKRLFGQGWITLGKRGEERKGIDEIMDELSIKQIKIFKVPKKIGFNKGILVEKEMK